MKIVTILLLSICLTSCFSIRRTSTIIEYEKELTKLSEKLEAKETQVKTAETQTALVEEIETLEVPLEDGGKQVLTVRTSRTTTTEQAQIDSTKTSSRIQDSSRNRDRNSKTEGSSQLEGVGDMIHMLVTLLFGGGAAAAVKKAMSATQMNEELVCAFQEAKDEFAGQDIAKRKRFNEISQKKLSTENQERVLKLKPKKGS